MNALTKNLKSCHSERSRGIFIKNLKKRFFTNVQNDGRLMLNCDIEFMLNCDIDIDNNKNVYYNFIG